ncbi:UDP-glucose epimerase [Cryobacterium roopkundense]|uniref:UDP-glucose epimerase n=1 Tax=Cryobacterium roopkundense TaxID=1001240 RepID=A0A099JI51_9MICO|nr:UDP-glucose epimerase [Cryobacterium roopkundense]
MRVLVTGIAGFIGSTTARALLDRGIDVVGIDVFSDYYDTEIKRRNIAALPQQRLTVIEGDLNALPLSEVLVGVDAVIHLAGQPGVRGSWGTQFDSYTRNNVEATQKLLEAARGSSSLRRFVFGSSSSVYGQATSYPTSEDTLTRPYSPYGVTKLAGEHLTTLYRENFGLPTVSFRFFTVYGPRQRPDMAFSRFFGAARQGEPITVYGDGLQIRDFTYVDDIVAALVAAIDADGELPPVMNLSGGSSVTVLEILDLVEKTTGMALNLTYLPAMDGDVTRTGGSATLVASALGWSPLVDIQEGLQRQFDWAQGR